MARQVGMAPSAILERIRKLEKNKIIDGYEVRLNPKFFNWDLIAFIHVFIEKESNSLNVGNDLSIIKGVQEVHYINGKDCYLVKIRVKDTLELNNVLNREILSIKNVRSTKTGIALSTYLETSRIPMVIIETL